MTIEDPIIPPAPSYFIDEGIPGVGDRPAWLSDKFKTVADLGRSYSELEKKFGTVPDEYDISGSKILDKNHEGIKDFLATAKDKRVSKDVIDKMVNTFDRYIEDNSINPDQELQKLGANAKDRLAVLDNWAKANLSQSSYEALTDNLITADSIKALEEIRSKMMLNTTQVPPGNDSSANNVTTVADIQAEMAKNLEKYKTDPDYRKNLQGRLQEAAKNSGYVDKSAQ